MLEFGETKEFRVARLRLADVSGAAATSLHHSDSGVNLGGKGQHDFVRLAINSDTHAFLNVGRCDIIMQSHDEFCVGSNVDDIPMDGGA